MNAVTRSIVNGIAAGYRPGTGPLHTARVAISMTWFAALMFAAMLYDNPLALVAILVAVLTCAALCQVLVQMRFALLVALPIAVGAALINPLVTSEGVTVLIEGLWLPLLGRVDITQEALVYGMILGLRALTVVAIAAVYVAVIDPDGVLRLLRRGSVRSAITATLASRMVPLLARDSINLATARECRPGPDPGSLATVRSVFARSFERAEDAALALELRGYSHARRAVRTHERLARAEIVLLFASAAITALAVGGKFWGLLAIDPYPLTVIGSAPRDLAFALLLAAAIVGPVAVLTALGRAAQAEMQAAQ